MKKLIVFLLFTLSIFANGNTYEKGKIVKELEKIEPLEFEEELDYSLIYKVKILSGKDKGKELNLLMPFYKETSYNLNIGINKEVLLYYDIEMNEYYIIDRVRSKPLFALILVFVSFVIMLAKFKGLKALFSLGTTILFLFLIFIPLIVNGVPPVLASLLLCLFSSLVTIFAISGLSEKSITSFIGTLGGVALAALISQIFIYLTGLTGYIDVESQNYAFLFKGIDLKELISAGIIIGSLGATMDIAVSISAALFEIDTHVEEISRKKIFISGINIGKDIIGTMVNTLILAYLGSSIFTMILFLKQRNEFPLIRILNSEFIVVEILRAFTGSLGILIAVPVTAYIGSILISKNKKNLNGRNKK